MGSVAGMASSLMSIMVLSLLLVVLYKHCVFCLWVGKIHFKLNIRQ